jgi:2'-5' RNA ligase
VTENGAIPRAFLACPLPPDTAIALEAALAETRRCLDDRAFRWVRRHHWHLTLRFFGAVAASHAPRLRDALDAVAAQTDVVRGTVGRPIGLPSWRSPAVAAFRLESEGALEALAALLDEALAADFGRADRTFLAHLTVLRVRRPNARRVAALRAAFEALGVPAVASFELDRMALFRSDLLPEGPRYTVLGAFPFRAGPPQVTPS